MFNTDTHNHIYYCKVYCKKATNLKNYGFLTNDKKYVIILL